MKMHQFRFHTNNRRSRGFRLNIYLILWIFIICGSVYLLVRFAAQSFSEEMGHTELKLKDAIMYYISNKAMESGSLVGYTANALQEETPFPYSLVSDKLAILGYVDEKTSLMAKAKEYSSNDTVTVDNQDNVSVPAEETMENTATSYQDNVNLDSFRLANGIGYNKLSGEGLSKEYILTNGNIYNSDMAAFLGSTQGGTGDGSILVDSTEGDMHIIESEESSSEQHEAIEASNPGNIIDYTMEQMQDINFLIRHFYIVDSDTKVIDSLFDAK